MFTLNLDNTSNNNNIAEKYLRTSLPGAGNFFHVS